MKTPYCPLCGNDINPIYLRYVPKGDYLMGVEGHDRECVLYGSSLREMPRTEFEKKWKNWRYPLE